MAEVEWVKLKAHELRARANENAVVIIPTAAVEQHGPHLPTWTDTCIGHAVATRAAEIATAKRPTLVTPVVWSGLSEHHMPFGGTLTLDYDTFLAVLRCLVKSLVRHGFRDVLISNSHGGNILAIQCAADQLAPETGATVVATTYVRECADKIAAILEDQPHIMHAGEGETAMMMELAGDLVDTSDLASLARPRGKGALAAGNASYRWRSYASASDIGITGNPARATAEKGRRLIEAAAEGLAELITDPETWADAPDKRGHDIQGVPFRDR